MSNQLEQNPHIAIVASFSGNGGVERMLVNLMHALLGLGVQVDLVRIKAKGAFADQIPDGVRIIDLPTGHALTSIIPLARYLQKTELQAVLAAKDRASQAVLAAKRLSKANVRVCVRLGTTLSASLTHRAVAVKWIRYTLSNWLYRDAQAVIAVSKGVALDTARITGLPQERIHVLPNPAVHPNIQTLAEGQPDHPWFSEHNRPPLIIGAGRLTRQKDFPTLIRAVHRVRQKQPVRLMILGHGEDEQALKEQIHALGLEDTVCLADFQANPYAFMSRADLFVLSSAWEGSPNVLTEAMALGVPVVATDCPSGPAEILDQGRLGPLVPVGDDAALAEAICRVLDVPPQPQALTEAVAEYRAERSAARYLDVLIPGWRDRQGNMTGLCTDTHW